VVLPLALFYGGLAQLLAGMWEFRKGNTFGATAFSSFGAFWLAYAAYAKFVAGILPASTAHQASGLFLLAWAIFTVYMTVAATRTTGAVLAVFATLSATFIVLCIGDFAQSPDTTKAGGWLGLVTAACAWYASFAGVTNSTYQRAVVPVFPNSGRSRSRSTVAVPRWITPSMMWTIWNAAIGSSSWRVRLGGRGMAWPFQSAALHVPMSAQRLSER